MLSIKEKTIIIEDRARELINEGYTLNDSVSIASRELDEILYKQKYLLRKHITRKDLSKYEINFINDIKESMLEAGLLNEIELAEYLHGCIKIDRARYGYCSINRDYVFAYLLQFIDEQKKE